jgi:hypothetical protein
MNYCRDCMWNYCAHNSSRCSSPRNKDYCGDGKTTYQVRGETEHCELFKDIPKKPISLVEFLRNLGEPG